MARNRQGMLIVSIFLLFNGHPVSVLFPIAFEQRTRGYAMLAEDVIRSVVLMKTVRLLWRLLFSLVCRLGSLYSFLLKAFVHRWFLSLTDTGRRGLP